MENELEFLLANRSSRKSLFSILDSDENQFENAFRIAIRGNQPQAWRATWLINQYMDKNDERINNKIKTIFTNIKFCADGHQREWLKVLEKMKLNEDNDGRLFDICITIWEDINKSPSVRIVAFRSIVKIVKKYPELIDEITHLTDTHYTESLSSGIKNSFNRLVKSLRMIQD